LEKSCKNNVKEARSGVQPPLKKTGQDLRSQSEQEKQIYQFFVCLKGADVKLKFKMKKKNFLFMVLVSLFAVAIFSGCDKGDGSLIGEWYCAEIDVTFKFSESMGGRWQTLEGTDEGGWTLENNIIYLTYWETPNEPIWGTEWRIIKLTSKQLVVDAYDEDGKQGTMTLVK
jgi:hypothetical protein